MSKRFCVPSVKGLAFFVLCLSWQLTSCGGGTGTNTPAKPTLQSISVSPGNVTVAAGLTQQYTAAASYSDGSSGPLSSVTWTSSDATLATVNSTGLVTTLKQGALTVSAASGTTTGTAALTVGPPDLQSVSVAPQNASVAAGLTQPYTATGSFSDGSAKAITAVTWSVSNLMLATVDFTGLVTTLKQGTVVVTAASGSISNTASLNVLPPIPLALKIVPANDHVLIGSSTSTKLSAILTYSDGSTPDVSNVATWSNTNSFIASIDSSGDVTPLRSGYTGISASNGAFSATTGFTVIAEPRYLYFASASGGLASKAIIDSNSGQLHMAGYVRSGVSNDVFPCPTTDPLNQFLYVESATPSNNGAIVGGNLQTYSIDPISGSLTPVTGSPFFSASAAAGCVDFEPTGKFAFVTININSATLLATYSRDTNTGILTLANSANLEAVPTRAAIDPLGQYLYIGASFDNFNTTTGLGFRIDSSTGTLTALPGSPFKLSNLGGTFTFHPSGSYLYMANANGQSIDTYSVARSTGALTLSSTISTCINPTPLRFSPDGAFAYTTCSMTPAHIPSPSLESFAVGPNGALTHVGSTPSPCLASDLTVDPSGQFLYLSSSAPCILESAVGVGGVAGPVRSVGTQQNPSTSNVVVGGPSPVKYTPKTAYITSAGDNTLSTYGVNSDGTLTTLQSPINLPSPSPFSLSLWPWGTDLVFASEGATPNIAFYSLSSVTGEPTAMGSLKNAATAGGAAIDPSGQFAFQTDSANGVVFTYEKLSSGAWALLNYQSTPPVTSFSAGPGAGPIVIDPAGLHVYVANQAGNSISVYQYWGISPQLLATTGSPFSLGAEPLLMAIDPNESFLYVVCDDHTLRVFSVAYFTGGTITQVASVSLAGLPSGLAVEPTGHFVYTSDGTGVSAFAVNSQTGMLTAIPLNPAVALSNSTGVYAEPAGQYLYVTTGAQNVPGAVFGYSIHGDGTLTAISASPLATPKLPTSMTFSDNIQ